MKNIMIITAVLVSLSAIGCEQADKAFEALDKAKNLKADFEKAANEAKKDIIGKSEAALEGVKKSADSIMGVSNKDNEGSEQKHKSTKEEKGRDEGEDKDKKD